MSSTQRDFTQGPIAKSMVSFSMPFLLSNILQALYGAVDMLVVGNYSSPDPVISAHILLKILRPMLYDPNEEQEGTPDETAGEAGEETQEETGL